MRKTLIAAAVLVAVVLGFAGGVIAQTTNPIFGQQFSNSQSIVTNGISRIRIVTNVADRDYSLKFDSGDKTNSVSVIRLQGPDSEERIQQVYFLLGDLFRSWGMNVE